MRFSPTPAVEQTIKKLLCQGLPPIPVAPRQQNNSRFSGKNPSFLNWAGKPILLKHGDYQHRLPRVDELREWFGHEKTGIGVLGGHGGVVWLDLDVKNYESQEACDRHAEQIITTAKAGWVERTGSGGWRIPVKPRQQPGFTNFSNVPGGPRLGEALGTGRFAVLAPTIHPNGNPYRLEASGDIPAIESLEALGLYPTLDEVEGRKRAEKTDTSSPSNSTDDPWDIRNFARFFVGYTERADGWGYAQCPHHEGAGSLTSFRVHLATGAFKAWCGCNTRDVYRSGLALAGQQGWQLPKQSQGKRKKPRVNLSNEVLTPDLVGEERYISTLMDQAKALGLTKGKKLIVVKSPHNTGKTHWLKNGFFAKYQQRHTPIWALTYRQSLERAYGQLFGIPTRSESQQYRESIAVTGATMCIHSMHPQSMARFDGEASPLGPVSLDEVRGVLQELVDSNLVKRGKVLPHFTAHLRRCIEAGFPVVALDAAVTDLEVHCLMKLLGLRRDQVLTVENTYQPWQGRQVYPVGEPAAGILELKRCLRKSPGPIWITTSGQQPKSRYGSQTLESVCKSVDSKLKVLRVDSETVHQQDHPAAKLMVLLEGDQEMVNDFLKLWDVVIVSPVVESGISVELFDHFQAQFSFVSGGLPAEAATQQILRLRDTSVPIYLASPERGMDCCLKRGNGSPDLKTLRVGELQRQRGNLHQLLVPHTEGGLDASFTDYWLAIAARLNGSIPVYSDLLKQYLERVGCEICEWTGAASKKDLKEQKQELAGVAVGQARERASEIAGATDLTEKEYETLKQARYKTPEQARAIQRYELRSRYRGLDVDETLARVDMEARQLKPQVMLEFYLTVGRNSLKSDEQQTIDEIVREGPSFAPDVNRKLVGHKIHCLELLGIAGLLKRSGEQLTNQDEAITAIGDALEKWSESIKVTLGVDLPKRKGTIWKINHLCRSLLGWTLLAPVKTRGRRGEKRRVLYEVVNAATSPTFQAKEKDNGDDRQVLATPPELLKCRSRFLERLTCLHHPDPVSV